MVPLCWTFPFPLSFAAGVELTLFWWIRCNGKYAEGSWLPYRRRATLSWPLALAFKFRVSRCQDQSSQKHEGKSRRVRMSKKMKRTWVPGWCCWALKPALKVPTFSFLVSEIARVYIVEPKLGEFWLLSATCLHYTYCGILCGSFKGNHINLYLQICC